MITASDDLVSWREFFEALPDGCALIDSHGVMRHVNDLLSDLTGFSREELTGQNVDVLIPERHSNLELVARTEYERDPNTRLVWSDRDLSVLRKDGTELPIDFAMTPLNFGGHQWVMASIRDNSAQRHAEQARAGAELQFRLAFEDNMAPMLITDRHDIVVKANDAFCTMVGRSRNELLGFDSKPFTHPEDVGITESTHEHVIAHHQSHVRYVKRYLHRDGQVIVAEVSRSPVFDEHGNVNYFIISERDITEERALTEKLSFQALHDPLTGLANRALFEDRMTQTLSRMRRSGGAFALLIIDLDDFKAINDDLGHLAGDDVLIAVGQQFARVTRDCDTLCRFGGDEFLYLAESLDGDGGPPAVAQRLLEALNEPLDIGGQLIVQHASIGVAVWNSDVSDRADVIRNADTALYEAKKRGKSIFVCYDDTMGALREPKTPR